MITHSERHIFHTILFYLQADEEERRKCRPEIETYLERARKYREYYTKPVQRGISFFDGELPEDEVKLPAFPSFVMSEHMKIQSQYIDRFVRALEEPVEADYHCADLRDFVSEILIQEQGEIR